MMLFGWDSLRSMSPSLGVIHPSTLMEDAS